MIFRNSRLSALGPLSAGLWLLAFVAATGAYSSEPKPNIIFIMADDLGYGDLGFNGQQHIKTPHLDRMATEGMVLTQHYAGSTVCMPSRGSLLTGKHLGTATIRGNPRWTASGNAVDLLPSDVTVAEELKRAGYRTGIVGKWGLAEASDEGLPTRQGFDFFFGYRRHLEAHHHYWPELWRNETVVTLAENDYRNTTGKYVHDLITEEALAFLDRNAPAPFFLYLAYAIPHYELTVPRDSKEPYSDLGWPRRPMKRGHYRHDEDGNLAYAGMVSRMDRDIGRLLERLKALGIADDTLVVFTSDNGPEYEKKDRFFNSNGDLRGGKRDLYEGGIRVPFVAFWPGTITPGSTSDHVSAFWDLLPTACDIAGIQSTDTIDGISFLPTLKGEAERQQSHDYLYWEFNERDGPKQALRQGDWKLVKLHQKKPELYSLANDPAEQFDLAAEHPKLVTRLASIMAEARTDAPEFPLVPILPKSN